MNKPIQLRDVDGDELWLDKENIEAIRFMVSGISIQSRGTWFMVHNDCEKDLRAHLEGSVVP